MKESLEPTFLMAVSRQRLPPTLRNEIRAPLDDDLRSTQVFQRLCKKLGGFRCAYFLTAHLARGQDRGDEYFELLVFHDLARAATGRAWLWFGLEIVRGQKTLTLHGVVGHGVHLLDQAGSTFFRHRVRKLRAAQRELAGEPGKEDINDLPVAATRIAHAVVEFHRVALGGTHLRLDHL